MSDKGYGRGLDFLREQREQEAASFGGGRMWKLWLRPGQQAVFYFVTEMDDVRVPLIHVVPNAGGAGGRFNDVACEKRRLDDDRACDLCDRRAAGDEDVKGPWSRMVGLVYVQTIVSRTRPTKPRGEVETRQQGGRPIFIEHVNETRLLISKSDLQAQIEEAYFGDPTDSGMEERDPTLLDRPYVLSRADGERTSESLKARSVPDQLPEEVLAARRDAPDLDEIIEAEFAGRKQRPVVTGSGRRDFDPERIPSEDDDDLDIDGDASGDDFDVFDI